MIIKEWIWKAKQATAFLDKRKIKIPESHKTFMLCDYWDCSLILSAEKQDGEFTFQTRYCRYCVLANLLDPESLAIAESIVKSRPVFP